MALPCWDIHGMYGHGAYLRKNVHDAGYGFVAWLRHLHGPLTVRQLNDA